MPQRANLENISIILVKTKTPGNIGSIARCMMNMGLSRLILVRPTEYMNSDALRMAAGTHSILEKAEVFLTLKDAIAGHNLIFGTTGQLGHYRKNIHTAREAAEKIVPMLSENRVAIVFGREVNGLDNEDISLCHELISIPSSDAFPSLNLSHAVMVVAYELFMAAGARLPVSEEKLADAKDLENFYEHLQNTLEAVDFEDIRRPRRLMSSFRQIFGRARLDDREVRILRGMLSHIDAIVNRTKTF